MRTFAGLFCGFLRRAGSEHHRLFESNLYSSNKHSSASNLEVRPCFQSLKAAAQLWWPLLFLLPLGVICLLGFIVGFLRQLTENLGSVGSSTQRLAANSTPDFPELLLENCIDILYCADRFLFRSWRIVGY